MIEGRATVRHGIWYLEYYLNNKILGTDTAPSAENAGNMVCMRTRRYVFKTLQSWLNQRVKWAEMAGDLKMIALVKRLSVVVDTHALTSYRVALTAIGRNAEAFMAIAPPAGSGHYHYYEDTILPILNFCTPKAVNDHVR